MNQWANRTLNRLATYLIRHAGLQDVKFKEGVSAAAEGAAHLLRRSEEEGIGRLGGGIPKAMEQWIVEGWLYIIIMSVAIGAIIGYGSMFTIKFGLRRKWIDSESFLLWPAAIGVSHVQLKAVHFNFPLLTHFNSSLPSEFAVRSVPTTYSPVSWLGTPSTGMACTWKKRTSDTTKSTAV